MGVNELLQASLVLGLALVYAHAILGCVSGPPAGTTPDGVESTPGSWDAVSPGDDAFPSSDAASSDSLSLVGRYHVPCC